MAIPVYSTRFAALSSASGTYDVICPYLVVNVIRDIDVVYDGVSAAEVSFVGSANQLIWFVSTSSVGHFQWQGRQVFYPTEIFSIQVGSGHFDITVSGYQLSNP